jgi:cytoskeletal protein RodZ
MPVKKITTESKVLVNEQNTNSYKKPMQKFGPALPIILLVLIVASGAAAVYFYQQLNALKANPQSVAQKEAEQLVARVSQLIVLPEGEVPTIATVQDPELLKEQPFFAKAKKGDKVLIYTNARKAILYDPVSNKIVEVAPVNIGNPQAVPAEEVSTPPPAGGPTP